MTDDDKQSVPLREYLDALDHARERAQDMAAAEREKTASILRTPVATTDVTLKEYFEAQRSGDQRALDMAAEERAKSAEVLRDEQRRALTVAQEEREKAAQALSSGTDRAIADNFARLSDRFTAYEKHMEDMLDVRDAAMRLAADEREKAADALRAGLDRAIREGDERLREHVSNQIQQIKNDSQSAEKLELARIDAATGELGAKIEASTREFRSVQSAAQQAVQKAEEAQLRVNTGQNEFRDQLGDQAATLMPRREVEALLSEQTRQLADLRAEQAQIRQDVAVGPTALRTLQTGADRMTGEAAGRAQQVTRHDVSQTQLLATLMAIFAFVSIIVIIAVGTHGFK